MFGPSSVGSYNRVYAIMSYLCVMPQRTRPDRVGNVVDAIIDETVGAVADAVDYTSNPPEWVNSGNPESTIGKISQAASRNACTQWANGNVTAGRSVQRQYAGMCGPYLEGLGAAITPDSLESKFAGGQCAGVFYEISIFSESGAFSGNMVSEGGFTAGVDPASGDKLRITRPNGTFNNFNVQFDSGWTSQVEVEGDPTADPAECGVSPPIYTPPGVTNPPAPVVTTPPVSTPAGPESVDVQVNPDGSITITDPATGNSGTFNSPAGRGDAGDPVDSGPTDVDGSSELSGEAPEGKVMLAVRVEVIESFQGARVELGVTPLRYSAGWVAFGRDDGNELTWFRIAHPSQLFSPQVVDAVSWTVKKSPGWRLKVTPIFGQPART